MNHPVQYTENQGNLLNRSPQLTCLGQHWVATMLLSQSGEANDSGGQTRLDKAAPSVSLIRLLALPSEFDGQRIQTQGYLTISPEEYALYLDRSASENRQFLNGLWIRLPQSGSREDKKREFHGKYVLVVGVFRESEHGHLGLWSGTLEIGSWNDIVRWGSKVSSSDTNKLMDAGSGCGVRSHYLPIEAGGESESGGKK